MSSGHATWRNPMDQGQFRFLRRALAQVSIRVLRNYIIDRDGGKCQYCGAPGNSIDHIIPVSKDGDDTPENLILACRSCNSFAAKRRYVLRRSLELSNDPDRLSIYGLVTCIDCAQAYLEQDPRASHFQCPDCQEVENAPFTKEDYQRIKRHLEETKKLLKPILKKTKRLW